jgi:hypothetical protein
MEPCSNSIDKDMVCGMGINTVGEKEKRAQEVKGKTEERLNRLLM